MNQTSNPYYQAPGPGEAWPAPLPAKLANALARMDQRVRIGATHQVYFLAYARRGDFYIDVARDHNDIYSMCLKCWDMQSCMPGQRGFKPLKLVLTEAFYSEADARHRCAELRAMPHAWQRRMVDRANPEWLDLDALCIGFPFVSCVQEDGVAPFSQLC